MAEKPQLILHIGAPKTGTSHLQKSFHLGAKELAAKGVLYPSVGRVFEGSVMERHVGLRFACEDIDSPANGLMKRAGVAALAHRQNYARCFWQKLATEIAQQERLHSVVMSDEALFAFANHSMIEQAAASLSAMFDDIKIIACIRQPSLYLPSAYSQAIKMGATAIWQDFRDRRLAHAVSKPLFLKQLLMWQEGFPKARMAVHVLQGDIMQQFGRWAALPAMPDPAAKGQNNSLSASGLLILRQINEFVGEGGKRPLRIRKAFEQFSTGKKWMPDLAEQQMIDAAFRPEMEEILHKFDLPANEQQIISDWFARSDMLPEPQTGDQKWRDMHPRATSANDDLAQEMARIFIALAR